MRPRDRSRKARAQRRTIDALEGAEAKRVLAALLDARPDLLQEALALAAAELGSASAARVASDVERVVGRLRIEDAWDRPGSRDEHETESACGVVEDAVEPFVQDLVRRIHLRRDAEALALCQGVLLGLYRVHEAQGSEFLDGFAPDSLGGIASWVAQTWRRTGGRQSPRRASDRAARRAFASTSLPEWEGFLIRIVKG